jgi:uncharacterized protein (DUF433 family)
MPSLIVSTPGILGGTPRIAGTRIAAATIASLIERGVTFNGIKRLFPELSLKQMLAVREWMRDNQPEPEPVDNGHRTLALYAMMYACQSEAAIDDECKRYFAGLCECFSGTLVRAVALDRRVIFTGEHITKQMYGGG